MLVADPVEIGIRLGRHAADDAEDVVVLPEQELGEHRSVLAADARDQSASIHFRSTFCWYVRSKAAPAAADVNSVAACARAADPGRREDQRSAAGAPEPSGAHRRCAGATSRPVLPSSIASDEAADRRRDHRSPVGHRLVRDEPVALAPRRHADDGRPLVVRPELCECGTKPTASGTATGPAPTITRGRPCRRRQELVDPLLGREAADEEHVRRILRLADRLRDLDPARDRRAPRAHRARARQSARDSEAAIASRARRRIGRKSQGARRATSTSVPQSWTTYGLPVASAARPEGSQCAWTRSASRAARRAGTREDDEKSRQEQREPRPPAQIPGDPVPVGDAEVAERRRRDDLDLHSLGPHGLDRVTDEEPSHVPLVPRVRGRQDDDLHWRRRAKTIGAASASIANAKK